MAKGTLTEQLIGALNTRVEPVMFRAVGRQREAERATYVKALNAMVRSPDITNNDLPDGWQIVQSPGGPMLRVPETF